MPLTGIGIAKDHRHPFRVQLLFGITVIVQRLLAYRNGPLLSLIHGSQHPGRNGNAGFERIETIPFHKCADLCVCLVHRAGVGIVEQIRVPAVRRHLGD